ncbi:hypothetical protein [Pontiella sp.]|uniref:hypothetical protein n=1 Tax=Pontiella sp. TaxID=2837462 RepID=UPI003562F57F
MGSPGALDTEVKLVSVVRVDGASSSVTVQKPKVQNGAGSSVYDVQRLKNETHSQKLPLLGECRRENCAAVGG